MLLIEPPKETSSPDAKILDLEKTLDTDEDKTDNILLDDMDALTYTTQSCLVWSRICSRIRFV